MNIAGNYRKPTFSCKEIEQAVKAYGWLNLCMASPANVSNAWHQLSKLYEQTCKYQREEATNSYILKDKPQGYLGYTEAKNDGLCLLALVLGDKQK